MKEILVATTVVSTLIFSVISFIKSELPNTKHIPVINCIAGISIGILYALSMGENPIIYAWAGLISALTASGFYDLTQTGKEWE